MNSFNPNNIMGHLRIQQLPNTTPWRKVIAHLAEGDELEIVVQSTAKAALNGLKKAGKDLGLAHVHFLLTQTVLAGRKDHFAEALQDAGLPVSDTPGILEIVTGFTQAADQKLQTIQHLSDIGEMGILAACETLSQRLREEAEGLFGVSPEQVKEAVRSYSTKKGFSILAHTFFTRFTSRFLQYHLERELSHHVGGQGRFTSPEEHTAFLDDIQNYCHEVCGIMVEWAGGWFSKAEFEGGITIEDAQRGVAFALKKIRKELLRRGGDDGD